MHLLNQLTPWPPDPRTISPNQKPSLMVLFIIRFPHALLIDGVCSSKPTCYSSAVKDPKWREAMNLEFDALLKNRTWTLVPSWVARSVIGCKWVF